MTLLAMATFALALSISPGPVNMIILTSGVNNGIWRTLPFVSGATVGFTFLLFLIGTGGDVLLQSYPAVAKAMNVLGAGFILYLGWKIWHGGGALEKQFARRPKFLEGAVLQWLNPKAWIACVSGIAAFVSGDGMGTIFVFCTVYFVLCFIGLGFWAVVGAIAKNVLNSERRVLIFNRVMGASLMAVSLYLLST